MKPLLDFDSPKYLRRLVRSLNNREHGFYVAGNVIGFSINLRCNQAKLVKFGQTYAIKCVVPGGGTECCVYSDKMTQNKEIFIDHNGQEIIASREQR